MARRKALVRGAVLGVFASVLVAALALLVQPAQARDNTSMVCQQTAGTVQTGLQAMTGQLQLVARQASSGDLAGANATVQQAGATLKSVATQVRQQNNADNPQLRSVLEQLATELDSLGAQLSDLTGLQNLDLGPLNAIGSQLRSICGPSAAFPTLSGPALPSPTS